MVVSAICYCISSDSPQNPQGKASNESSHRAGLLLFDNNPWLLLSGTSGYIDLLLLRLRADHRAIKITGTDNPLPLTISLTISRRCHYGAGKNSKTEFFTCTHDILPSLLLSFW